MEKIKLRSATQQVTGVTKDGDALFPIMPHHNFGRMDREDVLAALAYIRTLKPIENTTAPSSSDFPMNFIINTIPKPASFSTMPDAGNQLAYGEYLAMAASCYDCHTNQVKGQFIGDDYAGGMEFKFPDGSLVRSANITAHTTGLGGWTEEQFIDRFKVYADSAYVAPVLKKGEMQSPMPWEMYSGMTEDDLAAIFAYLRSIEPADNVIEKFVAAQE